MRLAVEELPREQGQVAAAVRLHGSLQAAPSSNYRTHISPVRANHRELVSENFTEISRGTETERAPWEQYWGHAWTLAVAFPLSDRGQEDHIALRTAARGMADIGP